MPVSMLSSLSGLTFLLCHHDNPRSESSYHSRYCRWGNWSFKQVLSLWLRSQKPEGIWPPETSACFWVQWAHGFSPTFYFRFLSSFSFVKTPSLFEGSMYFLSSSLFNNYHYHIWGRVGASKHELKILLCLEILCPFFFSGVSAKPGTQVNPCDII